MTRPTTKDDINSLYIPSPDSHKGQNGKLLVIGGSRLFHAASIWALMVASRVVDLVHYCSIPENNEIVQKAKEEFRNGIVVPRSDVEAYIEEDDCILIGPGMTRDSETETITNTLLKKYSAKQWVIDAGALQMMDLTCIPSNSILTPHHQEFEGLMERLQNAEVAKKNYDVSSVSLAEERQLSPSSLSRSQSEATHNFHRSPHSVSVIEDQVLSFAKQNHCIVLLKGQIDVASDGNESRMIAGGNAGMTKGGTGDVLAGLIAALACKNNPFLATLAGSFINKKTGDALYERVGPYFNATDLANEIPVVMKRLFVE